MLQALPDDILYGILQHASSWSIYSGMCFKDQLYLLGIFQRLRVIALPKIYSHVYIIFSTCGNSKTPRYQNKYSNTFVEYIETNADITALAGCTHMVKAARISVYYSTTIYIEFHNIIEVLKACSISWPRVTKLEFDIDYDLYRDTLSESQLMQCCSSQKQCQALSSTLPSVTELRLENDFMILDISVLFNYAVNTYADQLLKISYRCEFDYAGRHKLDMLQYLNISKYCYTSPMPCVNSHTLVDMDINEMPLNYSWAPFMDSKDDAAIEFSCLKKLRLVFSDYEVNMDTNLDMPKVLLNFPVLSSLTIECDKEPCSFFKMARFPKEIEYINLFMPSEILAQFKDVGMPTAKKVIIPSWFDKNMLSDDDDI